MPAHARPSRRHATGLLAAGLLAAAAALLPAAAASAQSGPPYYSFQVYNQTSSSGGPLFPVYDSVTFGGLQVSEVFGDGFTQTLSLGDLQTQDAVQSSAQLFTPAGGGAVSDPIHGALSSAVLSGTLAFPGIPADGTGTLSLTLQPTPDPASQFQQLVYTPFSASLFGPAPAGGIGLGTFSLLGSGGGAVDSVVIDAAPVPAAVPEASTTVSFGLLLALGLGGLAARRRCTAA